MSDWCLMLRHELKLLFIKYIKKAKSQKPSQKVTYILDALQGVSRYKKNWVNYPFNCSSLIPINIYNVHQKHIADASLQRRWSLHRREAQRKPLLLVQNAVSQNHVCSRYKSLSALHRHLQHVTMELGHVPVLDLTRKQQVWEKNEAFQRNPWLFSYQLIKRGIVIAADRFGLPLALVLWVGS